MMPSVRPAAGARDRRVAVRLIEASHAIPSADRPHRPHRQPPYTVMICVEDRPDIGTVSAPKLSMAMRSAPTEGSRGFAVVPGTGLPRPVEDRSDGRERRAASDRTRAWAVGGTDENDVGEMDRPKGNRRVVMTIDDMELLVTSDCVYIYIYISMATRCRLINDYRPTSLGRASHQCVRYQVRVLHDSLLCSRSSSWC